jgi:hypothetical protein
VEAVAAARVGSPPERAVRVQALDPHHLGSLLSENFPLVSLK